LPNITDITLPQVRYELALTTALFDILAEGLEFISTGGRIIYVVDYTEMNPLWNSKRPRQPGDLERVKVKELYSYLTGLERIFLGLEMPPDVRVDYLSKTYYEQMDFIDALVCNDGFDTIILPPHWLLLRDDITFFGNYVFDPLGNFNYAQDENERSIAGMANELSRIALHRERKLEKQFTDRSEKFGVSSASFGRHEAVFDLISNVFLQRANFFDAADFPWNRELYGVGDPISLARSASELSPNAEAKEKWSARIDHGSADYNVAYGAGGNWAHRQQGAWVLAYTEALDQLVSNSAEKLRVGLVTRNRQFHGAIAATRLGIEEVDRAQIPMIFHPRLLNAFMIDQGWDGKTEDGTDKRAASEVARKAIVDLQSTLAIIDNFIKPYSEGAIASPLSSWVTVRLRRAWEDYRRQGLAEQIQIRIQQREGRWKFKDNPKIKAHLRSVVDLRLERTRIAREQALINSIPLVPVREVGAKILTTAGPDSTFVVLVRARNFSHVVRFYSDEIRKAARKHSEGYVVNLDALFNSVNKDSEVLMAAIRTSSPFRFKVWRFEILLLRAILSVAPEGSMTALALADAALNIWRGYNYVDEDERRISTGQMKEGELLVGYIRRRTWLNEAYAIGISHADATRRWDEGIRLLATLEEEVDVEGKANEVEARHRILIAAIVRDLHAVAFQHQVEQEEIPIAVETCISWLERSYRISVEKQRFFTAARAKQQMIAFGRLYKQGALAQRTELSELLSDAAVGRYYRELLEAMKSIRQFSPIISEEDLPASLILYEALGKWICHTELNLSREDVVKSIKSIEGRMGARALIETKFREYLKEILDEMKSYVGVTQK
jgi:hypothetical protein